METVNYTTPKTLILLTKTLYNELFIQPIYFSELCRKKMRLSPTIVYVNCRSMDFILFILLPGPVINMYYLSYPCSYTCPYVSS